jgi:hypothetical protein
MGGLNMKTTKIKIEELKTPYMPPIPKSYSVEEILAAGGATAFANKMGKNPENIEKALEALPDEGFLTDEDVKAALEILREKR